MPELRLIVPSLQRVFANTEVEEIKVEESTNESRNRKNLLIFLGRMNEVYGLLMRFDSG